MNTLEGTLLALTLTLTVVAAVQAAQIKAARRELGGVIDSFLMLKKQHHNLDRMERDLNVRVAVLEQSEEKRQTRAARARAGKQTKVPVGVPERVRGADDVVLVN